MGAADFVDSRVEGCGFVGCGSQRRVREEGLSPRGKDQVDQTGLDPRDGGER